MPHSLDEQFSLYDLTQRVLHSSSTIINHRRTMNLISFEIENATLIDGARTRIYAGFQRMSKFIPQLARYRQLARRAESIHVFGIPDVIPPPIPGIEYVFLKPTDQLSKEWFLISYGQSYASVLATEELTNIDDLDDARMFRGVWTFDLVMAALLEEWLTNIVDAPKLLLNEDHHDFRTKASLVENIMNRLLRRVMVDMKPEHSAIVQGELRTMIKDTLYPIIRAKLDSDQQKKVREHEAVILFADIRNFTNLAERMTPADLVSNIINPYVRKVSAAIYTHGGMVDKFLGDGVLAVFGHDSPSPLDAERAVQAARNALIDLSNEISLRGLSIGFGIARGLVRIGEVGSEHASETTVIGDAVNTAQRLSGQSNNDIRLAYSVYEYIKDNSSLEDLGLVFLKGKDRPQRVYRATSELSIPLVLKENALAV